MFDNRGRPHPSMPEGTPSANKALKWLKSYGAFQIMQCTPGKGKLGQFGSVASLRFDVKGRRRWDLQSWSRQTQSGWSPSHPGHPALMRHITTSRHSRLMPCACSNEIKLFSKRAARFAEQAGYTQTMANVSIAAIQRSWAASPQSASNRPNGVDKKLLWNLNTVFTGMSGDVASECSPTR